jgi:hypothetical protein
VILRVGETYLRIGEEGKTTLSEEEFDRLAE